MMFLLALLALATASQVVLSSSPIPNYAVIGDANLAAIEAKSYATRERWAKQLLNQCGVIDQTLALLAGETCGRIVQSGRGAVRSVSVSAGGFEAVTDPTFIFDVDSTKLDGTATAILDNAVAFVLSQGGNGRFTTDTSVGFPDGWEGTYLSVTFNGVLTGAQATDFFVTLGSVDEALYNSNFAGFTQVSGAGKSVLYFISPDVPEEQFVAGLGGAVGVWNAAGKTHATLDQSAAAPLNVAFTWNDWAENQFGGGFLSAIRDLNGGVALNPVCVAALRLVRNKALRAAAFFIRDAGQPSQSVCQLASQDLVPRPPSDRSVACPRNLACADCQAAGCEFHRVQFGSAPAYGTCKPARRNGNPSGRGALRVCPSRPLTFPALTQASLNNLVRQRNSRCVVSSITPTTPAETVYVAATLDGLLREPVIQDVGILFKKLCSVTSMVFVFHQAFTSV